jgi:hypothetical protein
LFVSFAEKNDKNLACLYTINKYKIALKTKVKNTAEAKTLLKNILSFISLISNKKEMI